MMNYLFDKKILSRVDINSYKLNSENFPKIDENLILRPLELSDSKKGFLDVLKQLTKVGDVSEQVFSSTFNSMKSCPGSYFIVVIEDLSKNLIVGTATLVVEHKFIHECNVRGRVEDVVISNDYRGQKLGKILVSTLSALAKELNCYKVTLECKDTLLPFYESLGYVKESNNSNYLQKRFY